MAKSNSLLDSRRRFRERMPVAARYAYFDHAAVAPLSGPASAAIAKWLDEATHEGTRAWGRWDQAADRARGAAAQLLNAQPDEIAFISSTTAGISIVAEGLPWTPGDNVVTLADEFPSNQYPWLNLQDRGVEVRRLPTVEGRLDMRALEQACDARTRIVSISWVNFATGFRHDLRAVAEIAHRKGGLLFVDAIQGLGVFPLDVQEVSVDFLAADGHKWLLSPEGAGILYVRRNHLDRLRPQGVGWHSVVHEADFAHIELNLKPGAERFEGGSPNSAGIAGLGASLELFLTLGLDSIEQSVLELTRDAIQRLRSLGAEVVAPDAEAERSGIVAFTLPGRDAQEVRRNCLAAGVVLSVRNGRLRLSAHGYNDASDLERLLGAIRG